MYRLRLRGTATRLLTASALVLGLLPGCVRMTPTQAAEPPAATEITGKLTTLGAGQDQVWLLHLWGDPYQMGYAHGALCREQVRGFYERLLGAAEQFGASMALIDAAWAQMRPHVPERYLDEMRGLADGAGIDVQMVERAHAVPDLSEFHCTFFAAWGDATADGHLHQIRALDYEMNAGIQDQPALFVCEPEGHNAFVNIGWLGFIGCVSGMSAQHIALSEIGDHFGDEVETLAGIPMPFLMRRVLEEASSLDEALAIFEGAPRTSSFLYCIGDAEIPDARSLRTSHEFCEVWAPDDYGELALPEVVAWSMGQESEWNRRLYEVLKPLVGSIDERAGMETVMRGMRTGNLHAVHYDVTDLELWVANATPGPAPKPAYDQGFVHFDLAAFLQQSAGQGAAQRRGPG
ncbi:MAG: C45 family autoproteolytic acyltransferase/hydrolase [Armatimonadota bacterium]